MKLNGSKPDLTIDELNMLLDWWFEARENLPEKANDDSLAGKGYMEHLKLKEKIENEVLERMKNSKNK